jgi:four helix bundle protein
VRPETGNRKQETGNGQFRKGGDIAERLMEFAVFAMRLVLPKNPAGRHVALQLVRCATSAGANYEEARAAESPADFAHKALVAAKEAREAGYWLRLVHRAGWVDCNLHAMSTEAHELASILAASARTARKRLPQNP